MQVNLHEAKTHLSRLVDRAIGGEEIVIARSGRPLVRLTPYVEPTTPRRKGRWQGGSRSPTTSTRPRRG